MSYYTSVIILVLLALGVLSVLIFENNRIPPFKKRLFFYTNALIAFSALAEYSGIQCDGNPAVPAICLVAVKAIDYTLTPLTGGALIALMQKPGSRKFPIQWLFIGNAVFQLISAFTGWMVVIDENNHYTHGPLYPVYMVLCSAVLLILAVRLVSYGKSFRKQNRFSLYATVSLILIGIGMQELLGKEHRVAYLTLTFGAAFLFIHYSEFAQMEMDDQINKQWVIITKDVLTGVFSRIAYVDAIKAYSESIPGNLAVFMFDINGLKEANDTLGHEAGDELICGAAQCIENTVGKNGRTFRVGGDEFVVLANMHRKQADEALADFESAIRTWSGSRVKQLSVSAGYALAEDHEGCAVDIIVKEADKAMYNQKKNYYQQTGTDRRHADEYFVN